MPDQHWSVVLIEKEKSTLKLFIPEKLPFDSSCSLKIRKKLRAALDWKTDAFRYFTEIQRQTAFGCHVFALQDAISFFQKKEFS